MKSLCLFLLLAVQAAAAVNAIQVKTKTASGGFRTFEMLLTPGTGLVGDINNFPVVTDLYTQAEADVALPLKANLNSPVLTGTPLAPTAAPGTNTTQLATTAFVLANSSPAVLNPIDTYPSISWQQVDATGDWVPIWDTSVAAQKKIKIDSIAIAGAPMTAQAMEEIANVWTAPQTFYTATGSGTNITLKRGALPAANGYYLDCLTDDDNDLFAIGHNGDLIWFDGEVHATRPSAAGAVITSGNVGVSVQAFDADLSDLADGSLTGSKVGSGINGGNISAGFVGVGFGGTGATTAQNAAINLGVGATSVAQFANTKFSEFGNGNSGAGTVTLSAINGMHSVTLTGSAAIAFSNWPTTGLYSSVLVKLTQNVPGGWVPTWPNVVTAPAINPTASSVTWVNVWTTDGGTTLFAQSDYVDTATVTNLLLRAGNSTIQFEGATDNGFETSISVSDPQTTDRVWLVPDLGTPNVDFIGTTPAQTLTNKTLSTGTVAAADLGWSDGVKQTFNPDATNAGLNVGSITGDPSSLANGDIWYDDGAHELTARINGVDVALGAGGFDLAADNTFTGRMINSKDNAASAPVAKYTGAAYVAGNGTANMPNVMIEPSTATPSTTWNANGTLFGINSPPAFNGGVIEVKQNGVDALSIGAGGTITIGTAALFRWDAVGTQIGRDSGTGIFQFGLDAATTPAAVTIKGPEATGTDIAGGAVTLQAGRGSGTNIGGALRFKTSVPTTTGTTAGSATDREYIYAGEKTMTESTATIVVNVALTTGKYVGGSITATTHADDATDFQAITDIVTFSAVNKAGTVSVSIQAAPTTSTAAASAGTLTTTWTAVANAATIDIKNAAVSSLFQTTLKTSYQLKLNGDGVATITP